MTVPISTNPIIKRQFAYRFIQALMVSDELFVLLPSRHKVIRYGMEHLAIDFSLQRA